MLPHRRVHEDGGFTLVEMIVATFVLVLVIAASGPLFFGAMRLTGVTGQRSQATNLAVEASEQLRSLPYTEVGYQSTPAGCTGTSPVVLAAAGPLDALPTSTLEGHTTFTIQRCVYWSSSSMPGTPGAYKQTVVTVSWPTTGGRVSVSQTSALYPGTNTTPTTAPSGGGGGGSPTTTVPGGGSPTTTVPGGGSPTTTIPSCLTPCAQNQPGPCTATDDTTNPTTAIDLSWIPPTGLNPPTYYQVYYTTTSPAGAINTGSAPYSTSPNISGTSWVATVGPGATYYFQVASVGSDGTISVPSTTCSATTPPIGGGGGGCPTGQICTTSYQSAASATALSLALGGSTTAYTVTSPATSATNDGTKSNSPNVVQPTVAIPGADSFLSVTAATQIAEANTNGSSYACAGLLSSGASMSGGSSSAPCSVSGSGSGGVSLNLASLPGVGTAINSVVGGLTLNLTGATSWASDSTGGAVLTGSASLNGATVTVSTVGGLVSQTLSLALPGTLTSQTDIVQAITVAIGASTNPVIKALAAPLQTALAPVLTMTGDYQTTSGGVESVSALHLSVLGGAGKADLATSTVGANTSTTVDNPVPCNVSSLVVVPSTGVNGGGVALTSGGKLANQTSFQLAVSATTGCSNLQVGYAPTDCIPGANGCPTLFAALTGVGGTYYGTAGTSSTVWNVGTSTFTVYVGSPSAPYSPLAQQQVILCTQKGNSGKC